VPPKSSSPPRPKQTRLRAPVRRERILAAALPLFAERGYHASMGDVAAAAGITRTVLYHYFPSKQALFLAVLESQATELLRRIVPATTGDGTQEERLRAVIDAALAFAEEQPLAWDTLFWQGNDDDPEVREARERVHAVSTTSIIAMIGSDLDAAGLSPDGPEVQVAGEGGLAALIAIVAWWRTNPSYTRETLTDLVFPFLWSGFGGMLAGHATPPRGARQRHR
jgi:AcrR family transcriptional regulator